MDNRSSQATIKAIVEQHPSLTPKGRILGSYIMENPRKAVFMTTKELAETCRVSEATVVRFVSQLGFSGYSAFRQALRDFVDTDLSLLDRKDLSGLKGPDANRLHRVMVEEMDNLQYFFEIADMEALAEAVSAVEESGYVYVVGSRLSYTFAYYLGWSLTKIRQNVQILKGSDSTAIDWLTIAPADCLVVIIATARYPNELIRLGRLVHRLGKKLMVIADSSLCPLVRLADLSLVAPSKNIPFIGSPTTISCIINYLVQELASRDGDRLEEHQRRLEKVYAENDVLFNLKKTDRSGSP
ncbi:MAG: MurR/RpiR family transcriptional regulator [Deltaproteobacteria bacterium]|nr:MurR/RpiR family transcriptional regulator [Deltaproteobacteria bacterium]